MENNEHKKIEHSNISYIEHKKEEIDKVNDKADTKTIQVISILGTACLLMLGIAYYLHTTKPKEIYNHKCQGNTGRLENNSYIKH